MSMGTCVNVFSVFFLCNEVILRPFIHDHFVIEWVQDRGLNSLNITLEIYSTEIMQRFYLMQ